MIKTHEEYCKRTDEIIKELVRLEQQNALESFYHEQLCKELHQNSSLDAEHNLRLPKFSDFKLKRR